MYHGAKESLLHLLSPVHQQEAFTRERESTRDTVLIPYDKKEDTPQLS